MKKLLTILFLTTSITSIGQVSAGGGIGFGDKTNFVGQLSINWNIHHWFGIDGGFTAAMATDKPAFFTLQLYSPLFINNEAWKVSAIGGYSYKLLNEEMKTPGVNGGGYIIGLEAAKSVNNRGVLYGRLSYTHKHTIAVIGIRAFLGRRDYCY